LTNRTLAIRFQRKVVAGSIKKKWPHKAPDSAMDPKF